MTTEERTSPSDLKFGTFKGVFTPSILTILGVIMYLRFGWVVGNGGLLGAVAVVLTAHLISIATGMSICAISTNRTVKVGGDYYMISRGLGLPVGGAIGLALFFSLALSMSLYIIGFAESFLGAFGLENTPDARRLVGTIACIALTVVTFISTSLALKLQYFVLAAIALSLVSLFAGRSPSPPSTDLPLFFPPGSESFETLFAVFFPAVTGFTAGVAMSGDLKNPTRSIPVGTMAAILVGLAMYLAIPVFFAVNVDLQTLKTDDMVWLKVARVPFLVIAGMFAATLSSALGSILGAPRYLQALALDRVVPKFLGKGFGPLNEPRIGTVLTFVVAEAGILMGELNLIARIITMFFLTSYGVLCFSAGIQKWSGVMSYRPSFNTPAWVSFVGALVCLAVMIKLDMTAMVAATLVMGLVYAALKRRQFVASPKGSWGGFWAAVVQMGLHRLHDRTMDSQNWRPHLIAVGPSGSFRNNLVQTARWIVGQRGLSIYYAVKEADVFRQPTGVRDVDRDLQQTVSGIFPEMLSRAAAADSLYSGIINTAQSAGLPGMLPNTVLLDWAEGGANPAKFTQTLSGLLAMDYNLLLLKTDGRNSFGARKKIDIFWGGKERNSALMLLIAFLFTTSEEWSKASLRVNVIVDNAEQSAQVLLRLSRVLKEARVQAEKNVIVRGIEGTSAADTIAKVSADRDLVILGLREPKEDEGEGYVSHVEGLIGGLGTVLLVRASSRFDGTHVLYDDTE